ncbi:cytochrome P450 2C25-like [Sceloporus undulatus]|uniref:cytochrome P450 2C25-like n=1 Tax=Sceloporus undulatus TaxID=8520 RepID=UPI001C4C96B0|nr:cytochrome P450 2C25-like [Sceloporus undulatus]
MDLLGTSTVFLVVCLVLLLAWRKVEAKKRNFPPGPMPLPFIGNLLQLKGKNVSVQLRKLSEIYGPVFTVHYGPEPVVVIFGYETVKKVLVDNGDDFLNRGSFPSAEKSSKGFGIVFLKRKRPLVGRRKGQPNAANSVWEKSVCPQIHGACCHGPSLYLWMKCDGIKGTLSLSNKVFGAGYTTCFKMNHQLFRLLVCIQISLSMKAAMTTNGGPRAGET